MIIRPFDPWKSELCTCPEKYSLNPYTGCDHRCVYCYITSYIRDAFSCRPKKDLIKKVKGELKRIDKGKIISLSNSSDPYPQLERKLELTREVLQLLSREGVKVQIVTKSDIVVRDIDVLQEMRCCVSMTVTTVNESVARRLEPGAPSPGRRIEALKKVKEAGIPVSVRIDPIIPGLTDPLKVFQEVRFVDHITASTVKLRPDAFKRMQKVFPNTMKQLNPLFVERWGNALYLAEETRLKELYYIRKLCESDGISFGTCREGLENEKSCDGTHLI
jgi:DNA repair photolyase